MSGRGDNRSLALEKTLTYPHRLALCTHVKWFATCMRYFLPMGVLVVTTGVKTGDSPCCETTLSSGACIGRNVVKGQIARASSQCSQPSHSTHNTPLQTLIPVWAVSSQKPPVFLAIAYLSPTARNFNLITTIKQFSISGAWLRFQSEVKSMTSSLLASVSGS